MTRIFYINDCCGKLVGEYETQHELDAAVIKLRSKLRETFDQTPPKDRLVSNLVLVHGWKHGNPK